MDCKLLWKNTFYFLYLNEMWMTDIFETTGFSLFIPHPHICYVGRDISVKIIVEFFILNYLLNYAVLDSVQFSHSVVSDSLWLHELQHARPPCPSPTPGVHSNSCPWSQCCHPTISSSVVPFSSCPQSFPASESFQMSQLFASSGQSIGVSASASVLPMNTQDWSPLGWNGWISLGLR